MMCSTISTAKHTELIEDPLKCFSFCQLQFCFIVFILDLICSSINITITHGKALQGVLLGLSNTAGVLAGVLGTAATGYILQHGESLLLLILKLMESKVATIILPKTFTLGAHIILDVNVLTLVFCICELSGTWDDVFKVSVALYLTGTVVWNLFSTGEKILD